MTKPSDNHQMIHMKPRDQAIYKAWAEQMEISFSMLVLLALKEYTDNLEV